MGVHEFPILNPPPTSQPHIISLDHPRAPAPSILYPVSNIDWWFISYLIVYMFQCHSPKSSYPLPLPESKRVFYTSVSLWLSRIQGYHYHLSKFHIYVFVSFLVQPDSHGLCGECLGHLHSVGKRRFLTLCKLRVFHFQIHLGKQVGRLLSLGN